MADYEGFSHIEICSMVSATVGNLIKVGVGGVLFVKDSSMMKLLVVRKCSFTKDGNSPTFFAVYSVTAYVRLRGIREGGTLNQWAR